MPTVAELRAATQPPGLLDRDSGEHWAGRLYIRRVSPHVTRLLLATPLTPNGVTWLMIASGIAAGAVLGLPGLAAAVSAFALIQLQILLDCCDGEMARWKQTSSVTGVFLDRVGHFLTGAALPVGLGVRADGGWDSIGGYTTLGLAVAVIVVLMWANSALVTVARAEAGLPPARDDRAVAAPRSPGLRRLRRLAGRLPLFRAFVAMEFTLLALAAAVVDQIAGDLRATQALVVALVPLGLAVMAGRLAAILSSSRL